MFDDVVETFLNDAVQRDRVLLAKEIVERREFRNKAHPGRGRNLLNHDFERLGQTQAIQVIGPQVLRDLTHFLDGLSGGGEDPLELLLKLRRIVRRKLTELRAVFDDQQVLPQAVVQLRGDAFTFALLRFDQLAGEDLLGHLYPLKLRDAVFPGSNNYAGDAK